MSESNVRKFLDFLGAAEGAGYNTIVGGGSFSSYDKHPGTVGLVTKDGPSTAAGRYQITKTTYDDVAPKLGITDFSPASQDRIAIYLLNRNRSLEDVQAGNFEAAIAKNGGTWASLPSSPYNQPKRSMEFVNSYFGGNMKPISAPLPTLQNQTSAPIEPPRSEGAIQMAFREDQADAKKGGFFDQVGNLPSAIGLGFETQNSTYNWLMNSSVEKVDRDFRYTKDLVARVTAGIPPDQHGYILQGVSQEDVYRRRARVEEALVKQRELASMGAVGVTGTLVGSLVDLPTLVGFIPGLGTASVVSKTNRIKNALATGLVMASSNVAADAALLKYRPLGTESDLYWSAAAGLAFGLPIGAMAKTTGRTAGIFSKEIDDLAKFGQKTASTIQKEEFKSAGVELTEKGKRALDPEYRQEQVAKAEVEAIRQESKSIPTMERSSQYTDFVPTNSSGKKFTPGSTLSLIHI
jgi:muramidase (phage lysozyme)